MEATTRKARKTANSSPELAERRAARQARLRANIAFVFARMAKADRSYRAQLATDCGISAQAVGQWLKSGNIDIENLAALSRRSGYSMDQLVNTDLDGASDRSQTISDPDEVELVLAYRDLRPDEQEKARAEIMAKAAATQAFLIAAFEKAGVRGGPVSNERVGSYIKPAPKTPGRR
jgi:transcriptional regulator with XRE-family HTH domain